MKFSVIVCTYKRPKSLLRFLKSINKQKVYPDEILIIDGSETLETKWHLEQENFGNLRYFHVDEEHRGLTKQRNYGISFLTPDSEIVFFFDDDVILLSNFFTEQLAVYQKYPDAIGVGGYISNETQWELATNNLKKNEFVYTGWKREYGSRNVLRKKLGLESTEDPGKMPDFSHGLSTGYLPPSGEIYEVDYFMGCAMSFRRNIFDELQFSTFFEGYGLYEDMDFCLRVSQKGPLYLNTAAILEHFHEPLGRPNSYKYGKMVVRNGWYVWRLKFPKPSYKARFKWHATALLLTLIRFGNAVKGQGEKEAFYEGLGRVRSWFGLLVNKPQINR